MKVLIACEESQVVCKAFRERGHEAYSCDLLPCSGGHPEWHIQGDAIKTLWSRRWDLVIAHPPCTRLCNSGVRWITSRKPRAGYEWCESEAIFINSDPQIWQDLYDACTFFSMFTLYGKLGHKIRIENPIPHKYSRRIIGDPSQVTQPWMFGHGEVKATCFWNFNLKDLEPTNIVAGRVPRVHYMSPGPERARLRSETLYGVGQALATQIN